MEKLTMFLIFSLFFSSILTKHVKFTVQRQKDIYSDDDEELSMNILENIMYCNINVGNQKIPFKISFDKELTFIMNDNYTFSKFSKSKSKSFKRKNELSNSYVFDNIRFGYNATETFKLTNEEDEEIEVSDIPFILGTYQEERTSFPYPAQLGLKKRTYNNPCVFNFIEQLKKRDIINSEVFFFKFDDKEGGELILGEYPHEFDKNYDSKYLIQSSSLEMGTSYNWFLHFNYLFIGENKIDMTKTTAELTPEKGMIIMTMQMEKIFYDNYFKDWVSENKCVRLKLKTHVNYVCQDTIDISTFPNVTFRHQGMEYDFILEPKDLFYHYYDRYFFLISFRDSFYFFIGKPFFKKFNIIFNQDSKQLAIYSFVQESDNKEYNSMIVPTILIIIFSILVLVFVIILFRYKLKRKKLNEIEENYDYTPNLNKDTRLTEIN